MPEFSYARGRILDSLRYLTEEMREFQDDYAAKTWQDYQTDRKLQKLIDRTVENILTALIEICGAFLTEEGIAADSYSDVLKKAGSRLGLTNEEQRNLAGLAMQRNRLAHRYLNFRWQTIRAYSERSDLIAKVADMLLTREEPPIKDEVNNENQ
jgi:uncharacterized protein YutE (UPF0331/DUF86 family)